MRFPAYCVIGAAASLLYPTLGWLNTQPLMEQRDLIGQRL
jgi:hypothetical protein